ncbi:MAG: hypothetical protein BECKG1743F_GA0114225_110553, partial [Candidatus Kentron sp. G]
SDHERYPADVKCLGFLYLYVGRYPRNNASRNTLFASNLRKFWSRSRFSSRRTPKSDRLLAGSRGGYRGNDIRLGEILALEQQWQATGLCQRVGK